MEITNNFISSIDNDEDREMHSKRDNIETLINGEAEEVIKGVFDSLKNRCQNNLESMKGCEFVFHYVYLLDNQCHKINPNCGGSYVDSLIKNKKETINPINKNIINAFNALQKSR